MRFFVKPGRKDSALRLFKPLETVAELRHLTFRKRLHRKDVAVFAVVGYLFCVQSFHAASSLLQFRSLRWPSDCILCKLAPCAICYLKYQGMFKTEIRSFPFTSRSALSCVALCVCRK